MKDTVKGREWYQADEVAESYEAKRFSRGGRLIDRREKQAVLRAVDPIEERRVLEIACGTGRFTVMLAERGADVVGLDISGPMLGHGRRKAARRNVADAVEFMRGDAANLPFPDDHFDVVFAMRFFHLADTPAAYLSEMRRVARDRVFFDTFNGSSLRTLYNWALPMGSRLYRPTQVERLLATANLTLLEADHDFILPYGFYRKIPGPLARYFRVIDTGIGSTTLGNRLASVSFWTTEV